MPPYIAEHEQQETESKPVQLMLDLEGLIDTHVNGVDQLKQEVKKYKTMLDDILVSNESYQTVDKTAKDATKERNRVKSLIMRSPHAKELSEKIKELRTEVKEKNGALGEYVAEYKNISGLPDIELRNGEVYSIVVTGKLVKGNAK